MKIGDLKMDSSQKSLALNGSFTKIKDLKTDPKFKNYNVIFHICSAANVFTKKL